MLRCWQIRLLLNCLVLIWFLLGGWCAFIVVKEARRRVWVSWYQSTCKLPLRFCIKPLSSSTSISLLQPNGKVQANSHYRSSTFRLKAREQSLRILPFLSYYQLCILLISLLFLSSDFFLSSPLSQNSWQEIWIQKDRNFLDSKSRTPIRNPNHYENP